MRVFGCFFVLLILGVVIWKVPSLFQGAMDYLSDIEDPKRQPASPDSQAELLSRPEDADPKAVDTSGNSTLKGHIQLGDAEFAGPWEVLLFSADRLERHDQLNSSSGFVWDRIKPGLKVLHVLPQSSNSGLVHDTRTVTLKSGATKHVNVLLNQSTGEVSGRVVDESGVPQAYLYVQWVDLPWGTGEFRFRGEERPVLIQQAAFGQAYREVGKESNQITRTGTIRIIAPDFSAVGTFCDAGGNFRLSGVPQEMLRVQVSNGKELLWDGLLWTDRDAVTLSVPKAPLDLNAYKNLPDLLRRLRFDSMEEELVKQVADRPIYREDVVSSLTQLIQQEKEPERRDWLESVRKRMLER